MSSYINARAKAHVNFSALDINALVAKVRNGSATEQEFQLLASFCGTYLQKWKVRSYLIQSGIIFSSLLQKPE